MTELPAVPRHDQINAAWLSAALQNKGIHATVAEFGVEGVGTGQLGETKRFLLRYQGTPPAHAPRTVVGKFPSDNTVAAASGRDLGFYRSEVMFYRELAHRAVINTPKVYVAEYNADDGNFVGPLGDLGEHIGQLDSRLPVFPDLPRRAHDVAVCVEHGALQRDRHRLPVALLEHVFRVKRIHVRDAARHVEKDDGLRLCSVVEFRNERGLVRGVEQA